MSIPSITVSPAAAADAYGRVEAGDAGSGGTGFGATLQRALQGAVQAGQSADAQSVQAIEGGGNITDLVGAVSRAELALQTTVSLRDRMVQAYQQIMQMPI